MQLTKIKLAGFKSFVDPTTILLPSQLVAIVGPNGCGKSNVIDAVCWVMGESSAKYLRGESLTDVIFNGSSARKPVGQASVELVFDNQDGSIGGEYAGYAEISIRRLISRDGDACYFLNGVRCRRRDIIDIFLGTGLGPRSYSIIGQNMISRLIEAKPDDMRIYLEEAAGISKYKERRRETENRIQHTKENLERLNDIRVELEKQLGNLKRQAGSAEKFKLLKQEERQVRSQWLASQWRQLDGQLVQHTLQIQQQETGLESKQTELGETNLNLDKKREEQRLATELFQDVQRRYYAIGNEVTKVEQNIQHTQERERQWQADVLQTNKDCSDVQKNIEDIEAQLTALTDEMEELSPLLLAAMQEANLAAGKLDESQDAMQDWQQRWDEFNQRVATLTQTAQVEQTRITHLEQRLATIKQRQSKLAQDEQQINFSGLEQEIEQLSQQIQTNTATSEECNQLLLDVRDEVGTLQTEQHQSSQQLDQLRNQLQRLRGQHASLEALQQNALGQKNSPLTQWLAEHQLDKRPRLAQAMQVEAGWELAVEKALGSHLQAVCVDALSDVTSAVQDIKQGSLTVFATSATTVPLATKPIALLNKIKSEWPLDSLLSGIYVAETQDEAIALCASLEPHESVMTRDGIWLGASWLQVSREENPASGLFQREQELKQLTTQIAELALTQETIEEKMADNRERLKELERQRDELQKRVNQAHADLAQVQTQCKVKQERLLECRIQAERLSKEQEESIQQLEQTQSELSSARDQWQLALTELEQLAAQRETLSRQRDSLREQVQSNRDVVDDLKEEAHQLDIRQQTAKSQRLSLQQTLGRMQTQLAGLTERQKTLQADSGIATPLAELETRLTALLAERLTIEEELNHARNTIHTIEQELRDLESQRHEVEREVAKHRDMLETVRLNSQSLKVRSETICEQIQEAQFILEEILKDLPEQVSSEELHQQLDQITQRISRLGPINLVAIEEYATCSERKEYLDKQYDDLVEGLTTLEDAIAKIDKETRARFKETFDKVNDRFQELFPQIFGGGRASLELTGENLLDAGITVMACPPGKRNSTIHLLSGGEKAMTAIALVFSIFHLNPAPFCLLDEVDAPLDDANIGRFCQLVKTMSEKTQFIFISHNKLAIEMGEHLMGVTMHEPGVSRLVSVDVQEAMSLAGA